MILTTTEFDTQIRKDSRTFRARFLRNGTPIGGEIKNITINKGACGDKFSIGSIFMPYIDSTIVECNEILENQELLLQIGLLLDDSTVEYINMGYFTVSKPEVSVNEISFTAVGRISSKMNIPPINLPEVQSLQNLADAITATTGVAIICKGVSLNGMLEADLTGFTCREILEAITAVLGGFATEDDEGNVVISKYSTENIVEYNGDRTTSLPKFNDHDYELSGIKVIASEEWTDDEGVVHEEISYTEGTPRQTLLIQHMTESLFPVFAENIVGYTYRPGDIYLALGDPRIEPWDTIFYTDIDGQTYIVPCLNIVHKFDGGVTTDVTAPGDSETSEATEIKGPLVKKVERLVTELFIAEQAILKKITAEEADLRYATIASLTATDAKIVNISGEFSNFKSGEFGSLKSDVADIKSAYMDEAKVNTLIASKGYLNEAQVNTLVVNKGYITSLETNNLLSGYVKTTVLETNYITAESIASKFATISNLNALNATVSSLNSKAITTENLSTKVADLGYAKVTALEAVEGKIDDLTAIAITTDNLTAKVAELGYLKANVLETEVGKFGYLKASEANVQYARIDKANITTAWVDDLLIKGGILTSDINSATGSFSQYLTGVKILGNLIEAETLKANSLILQGEDGIYRRLNIDSLGQAKVDSDVKYNQGLDGSVLVKESITADRINFTDLFGQNITTTGNFNMGGKGALVYDAVTDALDIRVKSLSVVVGGVATDAGAKFGDLDSRVSAAQSTAASAKTVADAAKKQLWHSAAGTTGTAGYVAFAQIKITGTYANRPIHFKLRNRGANSSEVDVRFANVNGTDPALYNIRENGDVGVWIAKISTSTWYLIAKKSEAYDIIYVQDFENDGNNITVSWINTHYSALPTSNITQATKLVGSKEASTIATKAELTVLDGKITSNVSEIGALGTRVSAAEQTAGKISWLVASGTGASNFTLTDRVVSLLSSKFSIDALTTFKNSAENGTSTVINGGAIKAGTITADKISVSDLFAQDIIATGSITGLKYASTGTNGEYTVNMTLDAGTLIMSAVSRNISHTIQMSGDWTSFVYDNGETRNYVELNGNYIRQSVDGEWLFKTSVSDNKVTMGNTDIIGTAKVSGMIYEGGTTLSNKYAPKSHYHSANDITSAGYLNIHPENTTSTVIPFIHNDLAFLDKKGGSYNYYITTDTVFTAATLTQSALTISNAGNMFDGSPSYATLSTSGAYTAVVDMVLHKTFSYSTQFYIDFGSASFRAKTIEVYVMNSTTETVYVKKGSVTNNADGGWRLKFSHTSANSSGSTVQGFNRLRVVLKDFNTTTGTSNRRIAQLGLISYNSAGVTETFISRGGCSGIYGNLIPHTTNNVDLGSSSKKYKNVYATTFTGELSGNASTATKATQDGSGNTITSTYLKLAGGTLTGPLIVNGGDGTNASKFILATGVGQITNNATNTLFGFTSATNIACGHSNYALLFRGSAARPTYNGNNLALYSDVSLSTLGITATVTELNYMDGVTSKVQTQLDGKAPSSHTHAMLVNGDGTGKVALILDGNYYYMRPHAASKVLCGSSSYPWYNIYTERLNVTVGRVTCQPTYDNTVTSAPNMFVGTTGIYSRTTNTSSRTIKHDITDLVKNDLKAENLYDVNVVQFKYNDGIVTDKNDVRYGKDLPGFIIEDLNKKYPIAVDKASEEPKDWSWNAQYIIPPMLKLIQNQHRDIVRVDGGLENIKAELRYTQRRLDAALDKIAAQEKQIEELRLAS